MLKALVEWLEREYPQLVTHPWLASLATVAAALLLAAAWLTTAWRLGKWYYSRELEALRAENAWLRRRVEYFERTEAEAEKGWKEKSSGRTRRRSKNESPTQR